MKYQLFLYDVFTVSGAHRHLHLPSAVRTAWRVQLRVQREVQDPPVTLAMNSSQLCVSETHFIVGSKQVYLHRKQGFLKAS